MYYNETVMTYKTLSTTLSILLLLGLHQIATSQCSIENLTVDIIDCVNDNNAGLVVNFQSDTPSAIGYQISTQLGFEVIQYNQIPYTLTVPGNCITDFNLTVKDLSIADCEETQNVGIICCDVMCTIEIDIIDLQCVNDESILASVEVNISGTTADSLDIFSNNNYVSTIPVAEGSPISLPNLGPAQNLVVCSQGTECCDTMDIVNPCFCNIFDVSVAVLDCDSIMESYFLRVDFETTSPSSDSFSLGRTGNLLGTHAYADLPVRVGPISFDENDNDIFIVDNVDALCFGFIPHMTLDSCNAVSCELTNLNVSTNVDCDNDGDITFQIEFNTTVESEGFRILIDEISYGPFQYGQQPYNIGPLPSNGTPLSHIEIVDLGDESCSIDTTITSISCDCGYDNPIVTQFCNEDVLVAVLIDFEPKGAVSDSFEVISVVNTLRFAYIDLPITLNGLPTEDISLEITDILNTNCSLTIAEQLDCVLECSITNFEVQLLSCEELGIANLSFTFDYDDFTTDTVILSYNENLLGNYIAIENGEYIIPLLEVDCELDFNSFTLAPINDPDCAEEFAMPNIDCCTPCTISNVDITSTCFDDMSVTFIVDFDYDGDSTHLFNLLLFEEFYGPFSYAQVPIDISVTSLSAGDYPFSIDFDLCENEGTFSFNCNEECIVENIQLDTLTCSEGMFTASLNFDHTEANDSFLLFVNDIADGTYALDDLPIEIGPYDGDGVTDYTFTISVLEFESCIGTFDFGILDCGPNAIDEQTINRIKWSTLPNGVLINQISTFTHMTLIDLNGRIIQRSIISEDQFFIDNQDRMIGLYFVRLQDEKGNIHTIKIIL